MKSEILAIKNKNNEKKFEIGFWNEERNIIGKIKAILAIDI